MKKLKTTTLILSVLFYMASCKTHDNNPTTLSLIQNKWTIDSAILYDNPQMTGQGYKIDALSGYADFRTDNKTYEYTSARVNGTMETSYDTSNYSLSANNKQLISFPISDGKPATEADTLNILLLTDKNLVFSQTSINGTSTNGKVYYHR